MGEEKRHIPSWKEIREAKRADLHAVMDKDLGVVGEAHLCGI